MHFVVVLLRLIGCFRCIACNVVIWRLFFVNNQPHSYSCTWTYSWSIDTWTYWHYFYRDSFAKWLYLHTSWRRTHRYLPFDKKNYNLLSTALQDWWSIFLYKHGSSISIRQQICSVRNTLMQNGVYTLHWKVCAYMEQFTRTGLYLTC